MGKENKVKTVEHEDGSDLIRVVVVGDFTGRHRLLAAAAARRKARQLGWGEGIGLLSSGGSTSAMTHESRFIYSRNRA